MNVVVKGEAPWNIRAKEIKAEALVNAEMDRKAQQQQEEIRELIKEKKLKVRTNTIINFLF